MGDVDFDTSQPGMRLEFGLHQQGSMKLEGSLAHHYTNLSRWFTKERVTPHPPEVMINNKARIPAILSNCLFSVKNDINF